MHKLCLANLNVFWGGLIAETLARLGVRHAVISPGSRSAPLTLGFASSTEIEAIPVLDERSAAFFALGIVRRTRRPVALVCTSGTAAANYLPAVIEANLSGLPLIVLTADRPAELRDCAAGQSIDQRKLYGAYAVWEHELALPGAERLRYLRQTLRHAVRRSLTPLSGPVHLNVPFCEPLAPIPSSEPFLPKGFRLEEFLEGVCPPEYSGTFAQLENIEPYERGLIVAGYTRVENPAAYAETVFGMARLLGWPVLADVLSPLRVHAPKEAPLVANYHALLRDRKWGDQNRPEFVLQFGDLPTSKILRTWLADTEAETLVIDGSYRNLDSAQARATHVRLGEDVFTEPLDMRPAPLSKYSRAWLDRDRAFSDRIQKQLRTCETFFEGKIPWLLSRRLPNGTPVFISASMPIRDAELFWLPSERGYAIHANRGANGIDGTLSTALGIAHGGKPAILLTGDLAFLHDSNGLLSAQHLRGSLTVVLINNDGGRIFSNLAISEFDPPFEEFFATPQDVDFAQLAAAHDIEYIKPKDWPELDRLLSKLPAEGIRVVEVVTDAEDDVPLRKELLNLIGGDADVNEQRTNRPDQRERDPENKSGREKRRRGRGRNRGDDRTADASGSDKNDERDSRGERGRTRRGSGRRHLPEDTPEKVEEQPRGDSRALDGGEETTWKPGKRKHRPQQSSPASEERETDVDAQSKSGPPSPDVSAPARGDASPASAEAQAENAQRSAPTPNEQTVAPDEQKTSTRRKRPRGGAGRGRAKKTPASSESSGEPISQHAADTSPSEGAKPNESEPLVADRKASLASGDSAQADKPQPVTDTRDLPPAEAREPATSDLGATPAATDQPKKKAPAKRAKKKTATKKAATKRTATKKVAKRKTATKRAATKPSPDKAGSSDDGGSAE